MTDAPVLVRRRAEDGPPPAEPLHVQFAEWEDPNSPEAVMAAMAQRSPCPVCGHPTGDCTEDRHMANTEAPAGQKTARSNQAEAQSSAQSQGQVTSNDDQIVIKADEPLDSGQVGESAAGDSLITVSKEIVEEFYYPNTKRPSTRVLYQKGQVVRESELAKRAGLLEALKGDDKNPAGIDASTLASGTHPGPSVLEDKNKAKSSSSST